MGGCLACYYHAGMSTTLSTVWVGSLPGVLNLLWGPKTAARGGAAGHMPPPETGCQVDIVDPSNFHGDQGDQGGAHSRNKAVLSPLLYPHG